MFKSGILFVVAILLAPVVHGQAEEYSDNDLAAYEVALRDVLDDPKDVPVAFVTFGNNEDRQSIDPPKAFLERLSDLKTALKLGSSAKLPMRGERDASNRFRGVRDPETGKAASIYQAKIIRHHSETKIEFAVCRYGGPLDAHGYTAILERRGGKWVVTTRRNSWVS